MGWYEGEDTRALAATGCATGLAVVGVVLTLVFLLWVAGGLPGQ